MPITGPMPGLGRPAAHLPYPSIQRIVGRALIDLKYRERLLNGSRPEILADAELGLSADERAFLLSIRADTLSEFAQAVLTLPKSASLCCSGK